MQSGTILGERYTLGEQIGAGASGSVWTGHDTIVDRPVTIKVLKPELAEDDTTRERFRRVALKVAGLAVRGIVDVYDCLEEPDPDGGFLVCHITERVEGRSLRDLLDEGGTLPYPEALDLVSDAVLALHAAHREGVVHGNLKPENLIIGDGGKITIVDFGFLPPSPSPYTAPELNDDSPAADVYGLGAVLYECLTGQPPTADGDISPLLSDMYPADAAPIMKAMSPQPSHRYASVVAFADACLHTDPAHGDSREDGEAGPPSRSGPIAEAAAALVLELDLADRDTPDDTEPTAEEPSEEPDEADDAPSEPEPEPAASGEATEPSEPEAEPEPEPEPEQPESATVKATAVVASAAPVDEADADDDAPEPVDEPAKPRRSLRTQALVIGLLIAVLTVAAAVMHFAVPSQPSGSPASPDPTTESSKSSASESSSSATDVDRPPNSAEPAPTTSSPSPSASSPDGNTVQVPNVVDMRRESAETELSGKGFTVIVNNDGNGRWECRVHDQSPVGGENVPAGTTVTIYVRRVNSPEQCIDPS
ncbi:protein kinase domain-containing protein [Stackebrandtia nassauensis]|uniref:non-specific serine/threonine protein kinase n=1 Tax=Stackebrandtia nassauensis (strain DSM 44728 / CIP 108903 / NRRL B-16338 / NBRC 102104 / LLR-40K-21) TaxID=446470 RepID=D3Q259_STANL|nr:protein kinase [Stackebrandtia nassauensis]ADD41926.1 serine/threonine protein kinase with PASTA sensor(s) [Stackebrandtia nassauensis DSM 44728]